MALGNGQGWRCVPEIIMWTVIQPGFQRSMDSMVWFYVAKIDIHMSSLVLLSEKDEEL